MAREEERSTHKLYSDGNIGEVRIADEVVAIIAGLAATEVKGVASMAGNITNEVISKLGMRSLSKGVKVDVTDATVRVALSLNLEYGYNIPSTSEKVQEKVKFAIENMTGLNVAEVQVRIAGVDMKTEE
ncbi:MAG: Asp23/Gls24 family envelope stress response protein [Lachnospiraceae bacterium]